MRLLYLILLVLSLSLISCEKEVSVEMPEHVPVIVVNSYLSKGDTIKVHISESGNLTKPLNFSLKGALVVINNNDNCDTLRLEPDGWYNSVLIGQNNIPYHIKVEHPDFETVEAVDSFPDLVPFVLKNYIDRDIVDESGYYYSSVEVEFNDDSEKENFYEITVKKKGKWSIWSGIKCDDLIIKNENISDKNYIEAFPFSDQLFNGEKLSVKIKYRFNPTLDCVYIILRSTSRDYYLYKKSLYKYLNATYTNIWNYENTLSLHSNIEKGRGIFAGYSEYKDSIYNFQ